MLVTHSRKVIASLDERGRKITEIEYDQSGKVTRL